MLNAKLKCRPRDRRRGCSIRCQAVVLVNSPASQKPSRKSTADEAQQVKDSIDSKLNVDDLLTDGSFEVKVVIVDGTGKPTAGIPQDVESKQIVQEVCNKHLASIMK